MKLIRPYYEILTPWEFIHAQLKIIELSGRTCYKSEDKITDESHVRFIDMLVNDKHHESVIEHSILTVKFYVDRGVSHELVRHRIASFSQESTRYCNYSKDKFDNQLTFIIPEWIRGINEGEYKLSLVGNRLFCDDFEEVQVSNEDIVWFWSVANNEIVYNDLITKGWKPQQARAILPNSLKTEIVISANFREWRHIFKMRTSNAAHPQMREIMIPLLEELRKNVPILFDNI